MLKEFKEFAFKGSLMDTAIAFVMGAAFGKVTDMFVNGIFMRSEERRVGKECCR